MKMKMMSQEEFNKRELKRYMVKIDAQEYAISKYKEQIEVRDAMLKSASAFIIALASDSLKNNCGTIKIPKRMIADVINSFGVEWHENKEKDSFILSVKPINPAAAAETPPDGLMS